MNTQEYGRRPYGVGFLVIGQDQLGPHLFEFSPSGNSYEYYAMSIGARSQSAKTYLEKHFEKFADCTFGPYICSASDVECLRPANLEQLIEHGLHALRETLQQDKELTIHNTSIGIVGPASELETNVLPDGSFRILEEEKVDPFIKRLPAKQDADAPTAAAAAGAVGSTVPPLGDEDVQMAE